MVVGLGFRILVIIHKQSPTSYIPKMLWNFYSNQKLNVDKSQTYDAIKDLRGKKYHTTEAGWES